MAQMNRSLSGRRDPVHPDEFDALVHRLTLAARGRALRRRRLSLSCPAPVTKRLIEKFREPGMTSTDDQDGLGEVKEPAICLEADRRGHRRTGRAKSMPLSSSASSARRGPGDPEQASSALPDELQRGALDVRGPRGADRRGRRQADRAHRRGPRAKAARMVYEDRDRAPGTVLTPSGSSPRPRSAVARDPATRPRTSSTASSPQFEIVLDRLTRPSSPAASACGAGAPASRTEEPDGAGRDRRGIFDQDEHAGGK